MNQLTSFFTPLLQASITFGILATLWVLVLRTRLRFRFSAGSVLLLWALLFLPLAIPFKLEIETISPSTRSTSYRFIDTLFRLDPLHAIDWDLLESILTASSQAELLAAGEAAPLPRFHQPQPSRTARIMIGIWLTGFMGVTGFYALQHLRLQRLLSETRPASDSILLQVHTSLLSDLKVRRPIPLRTVEGIGTAAIVGLFRPQILLSRNVKTCSQPQIQSILLHELTHYRKGHLWINTFALCCTALHWFNPVVWLAYRQLRRALELACDEAVIRSAAHPHLTPESYAHHLLDLMSQFSPLPSHRLSFLGLFNNIETRFIQHRIVMIKNLSTPKLPMMLVLLVGLGCSAGAITQLTPGVDAPPPPPPPLVEDSMANQLTEIHITELNLDFDASAEEPSFSQRAKQYIKAELLPVLQSSDPYPARQLLLESEFANEAPVQFLMGNICLQKSLLPDAERHYINAINASAPHLYESAFKNLLIIYSTTHHGTEAFPLFEKYLTFVSDPDAQIYLMAGVAAMQAEKYEEAVPLFTKAIELDPNDPNAKLNLFQVYMHLENYAGAELMLQELIRVETDPITLASYHRYYTNVAVALKNPALAAEQLKLALALNPEDSESEAATKMLAEIYENNPSLRK